MKITIDVKSELVRAADGSVRLSWRGVDEAGRPILLTVVGAGSRRLYLEWLLQPADEWDGISPRAEEKAEPPVGRAGPGGG